MKGVYYLFIYTENAREVRQPSKKCDNFTGQVCYISNIFVGTISNCNTLVSFHAQLTRTKAELKGLMRQGIRVKQNHPTLSILAAMGVANFTDELDVDCTLKQAVSCLVSPPTKQISNYLQCGTS